MGSANVVEQTAIAGALNLAILEDQEQATAAAGYVARRLDLLEGEHDRGWQGRVLPDGGLEFTRTLRGVSERHRIDGAVIKSADARRVDAEAPALQALYAKHSHFRVKGASTLITGPLGLIAAVMAEGRKGTGIQRYKGLGEMNPEQLWQTTLDPNGRSLLQVKTAHGDQAEDIFSTLMGDLVEPRREFIQTHALEVANLDV